MKPRKLALRHEALADLTTDELGSVAGASGAPCQIVRHTLVCNPPTQSLLVTGCMCTGAYPSLNMPCTTTIAISGSICD